MLPEASIDDAEPVRKVNSHSVGVQGNWETGKKSYPKPRNLQAATFISKNTRWRVIRVFRFLKIIYKIKDEHIIGGFRYDLVEPNCIDFTKEDLQAARRRAKKKNDNDTEFDDIPIPQSGVRRKRGVGSTDREDGSTSEPTPRSHRTHDQCGVYDYMIRTM